MENYYRLVQMLSMKCSFIRTLDGDRFGRTYTSFSHMW